MITHTLSHAEILAARLKMQAVLTAGETPSTALRKIAESDPGNTVEVRDDEESEHHLLITPSQVQLAFSHAMSSQRDLWDLVRGSNLTNEFARVRLVPRHEPIRTEPTQE